ncbi:MAG: hypothetical protein CM15mV133_140 [uncultured marine virus]|nr:MAG: hypothetical protein CM15mV133_140 [uncultured marine virus]
MKQRLTANVISVKVVPDGNFKNPCSIRGGGNNEALDLSKVTPNAAT